MDLPQGPFGCILADPPWSFRTFDKREIAPTQGDQPYEVMSALDLRRLPVGDMAARHCALFMWATDSNLPEALQLGLSWGFTFKTVAFVWFKGKLMGAQVNLFTGDIDAPPISMGYWTRKQTESCLLFTRGSPRRLSKAVRQAIIAPRREHSRKPDEQYERIEALVGGPYLELFARQQRPGWTAWGNQIDKFREAA